MDVYSPATWGPTFWKLLHITGLQYDGLDHSLARKTAYRSYMLALRNIIPCDKCAEHYTNSVLSNIESALSNHQLFEWTIDLHNQINRKTGKDELTYAQAKDNLFNNNQNTTEIPEPMPSWSWHISMSIVLAVGYIIAYLIIKILRRCLYTR